MGRCTTEPPSFVHPSLCRWTRRFATWTRRGSVPWTLGTGFFRSSCILLPTTPGHNPIFPSTDQPTVWLWPKKRGNGQNRMRWVTGFSSANNDTSFYSKALCPWPWYFFIFYVAFCPAFGIRSFNSNKNRRGFRGFFSGLGSFCFGLGSVLSRLVDICEQVDKWTKKQHRRLLEHFIQLYRMLDECPALVSIRLQAFQGSPSRPFFPAVFYSQTTFITLLVQYRWYKVHSVILAGEGVMECSKGGRLPGVPRVILGAGCFPPSLSGIFFPEFCAILKTFCSGITVIDPGNLPSRHLTVSPKQKPTTHSFVYQFWVKFGFYWAIIKIDCKFNVRFLIYHLPPLYGPTLGPPAIYGGRTYIGGGVVLTADIEW